MNPQLELVSKDRTAAERQRRYRQRGKLKKPDIAVVTIPSVTALLPKRYGVVPFILLCAALAVAAVSGSFSVIGLTAVFTGAFWPIFGMGVALVLPFAASRCHDGRNVGAPMEKIT